MGARMLVVAGLNLDKAWPDEAVGAARALREASAGLLLEVAQRGIDLGVDGLVVLGGLWDPTTVRSSTVSDVRAVLGSMPYAVLVLPGEVEAAGSFGPQTLADWPSTFRWVEPESRTVVVLGGDRFAVMGPEATLSPPLDGAVALLTTHHSPPDARLPVIRPGTPGDLTRSSPAIAPLVAGTGGGHPRGALVSYDVTRSLQVADVEFGQHLGLIRRLTLDEYRDSSTLLVALDDLVQRCDRLDRVVVSGGVGPRVLVPPALPWQPSRDDVTVVWRDLSYRFPTAAPSDQTVSAELVRRLSGPGPDEARRHQALALGLSSLEGGEQTS